MLQSRNTAGINCKIPKQVNIMAIGCKIHTSADKIPAGTIAEVMKDSVAVILKHLSMDVEARVAKFRDFLGKKFHPVHRIAENNRLVYLKLSQR